MTANSPRTTPSTYKPDLHPPNPVDLTAEEGGLSSPDMSPKWIETPPRWDLARLAADADRVLGAHCERLAAEQANASGMIILGQD